MADPNRQPHMYVGKFQLAVTVQRVIRSTSRLALEGRRVVCRVMTIFEILKSAAWRHLAGLFLKQLLFWHVSSSVKFRVVCTAG